jgi:Flp pilus assembly protein TadD
LIGYAARAEGLYDEALVSFNRALVLQPDNADVITNLGYIASQRGESQEAERLLRKAITLDPNNFPAHHDLGRLLIKLKRFEEAVPILERGVALNGLDAGIHYQLFTAYSRLKRKADAELALAKFKEIEASGKHVPTALGVRTGALPGDIVAPPELPASVAEDAVKNQARPPYQ